VKRLITVLLASLVLTAGCGVNSVIHSQPLWCTYHAWRLEHDIRYHHYGWAGFQAILTAHHCSRAIRGPTGIELILPTL
jgi:hypothetical protein